MKSTQSRKPCNDCEVEQGSLFSSARAAPRTEAGLVEVRRRVDAILAGSGLKKDAEALLQEHSMRYMRRQVLCLCDSMSCSFIHPHFFFHWQPFWTRHPFFDPTTCLPPDRMHQTDAGLFKTMMQWMVRLLEVTTNRAHGSKAQQVKMVEFNRRWAALLPFTDMKVFLSGVSHLTQMNAFEYRDMMKSVLVITRGVAPYIFVYICIYSYISVYKRI